MLKNILKVSQTCSICVLAYDTTLNLFSLLFIVQYENTYTQYLMYVQCIYTCV